MSKRFVLKMQLSEFPYEKRVLIYNKNKTIMTELPVTPEIKKLFNGKHKIFVLGEIDGATVNIVCKIKDKSW
jgi:hypothetical protein